MKLELKNLDDIIEDTAAATNTRKEVVDKVLRFQWKAIRDKISNIEFATLRVPKLGEFYVKGNPTSTYREIKRLIGLHRAVERGGSSSAMKNTVEEQLEAIKLNIRALLRIRKEYKEKRRTKLKYIKNNMILIPLNKVADYVNYNLTPSFDYTDHLSEVVRRAFRGNSGHFERFPEHKLALETELSDVFNDCVLHAATEQKTIEKELGIVSVKAEFFSKEGIQVSFKIEI